MHNCSKSFPANTVLVSIWSCSRTCGTNFACKQSFGPIHTEMAFSFSVYSFTTCQSDTNVQTLVTFSSFLDFAGVHSCSASCSNSLTIFKWTAPIIHNGCFEHQQHFYFKADCNTQTCPSLIQLASQIAHVLIL